MASLSFLLARLPKQSSPNTFQGIDRARHYQRRRNDNINTICVLEGVEEGENLQKIASKRCFSWEIP